MRQGKKFGIALAGAIAAGMLSTPAQASVYTIDWTGLITNGYDDTGIFGLNSDLSGQTILVKVRVDTKTPGATYVPDEYRIIGLGSASPISAWITINGVTRELLREYEVYTPSPSDFIEHNDPLSVTGYTGERTFPADDIFQQITRTLKLHVFNESGIHQIVNYLYDDLDVQMRGYPGSDFADGDLETAPISHVLNLNERLVGDNVGFFKIFDDFGTEATQDVYDVAEGQFDIVSFTVTADGSGPSVPEPASWVLMIAGLGLAGIALRGSRRQRRAGCFA